VDYQYIDGLLGGADPDSDDPFAGADVAELSNICLEPNEPLKLDFSVTPRQVLYDGTYAGLVRLIVGEPGTEGGDITGLTNGETEQEIACEPTLGSGENASGDSDGVFNNLPGEPVEGELSGEPTPEPTETPTGTVTVTPTEPTETPTGEPTETPTEPTETPTGEPTETPTEPTETPTEPTETPTGEPTETPTEEPTGTPTEEPTEEPTEPAV
jgi:hypothetical protein